MSELEINNSIKDSTYWENIKTFKEKYFGAQDEYFEKNYQNNNNNTKLNYQKTVNIEANGSCGFNRICSFTFPTLDSNKLVYKNLRVSSNKFNNVIDRCELECNGSAIDKVYGRVLKTLRYIYNINDDTLIPFYFNIDNEYLPNNMSTIIYIRFGSECPDVCLDDFSLSVDIYEIDDINFSEDSYTYNNTVVQCNYTGMESASRQTVALKFKTNFNHVMNYILVSVPDTTLTSISLQFDGYDMPIPISDIVCYDRHYIIPLTMSLNKELVNVYGINFSSCNTAIVSIKYNEIVNEVFAPVYIYGISRNTIIMFDKLIGLMYSK
jgi:hypothetical protein